MPATATKPQKARMFRVACAPCGTLVYASRSQIARAVPVCGMCGEKMQPGPKISEYGKEHR